jgi:hypothetical protein
LNQRFLQNIFEDRYDHKGCGAETPKPSMNYKEMKRKEKIIYNQDLFLDFNKFILIVEFAVDDKNHRD